MSYQMTLQDSPRYLSGEFDYEVVGGDTIYYHNYPDVSSTNNLGSVTSGNFLARAVPSWVVSAGTSYIVQRERAGTTDPSLVEPQDGAGSFYNAATRTFEMVTPTEAEGNPYDVRDYGAVGDGVTDDTAAIQAAIDACSTAGPVYSGSPGGVVYLPQGTYKITSTIELTDPGVKLMGAGRGGGGATSTSGWKKAATKIVWAGTGTDYMLELNPGGTLQHWGAQIESLALHGDNIAGISGVRCNDKAAGTVFRDIEITGVVNGYVMEGAWSNKFFNCGVYDYSGWGWDMPSGCHDAQLFACTMQFCTAQSPSGGVRVGGEGSTEGVGFHGCDFEPNDAPVFLDLKQSKGATVTGCHFEARDANTEAFIRIGNDTDTTVASGAAITGSVFAGHGYAESAVEIQYAASGVVIEGNYFYELTESIVKNTTPGTRNRLANNGIESSITELFTGAGAQSGFARSTRGRTTSDNTGNTSVFEALDTTHTSHEKYSAKIVRAVLRLKVVDSTASNTNSLAQLQIHNGSTWVDYGWTARAGVYVNTGTGDNTYQTLVLEEELIGASSEVSSVRAQVEITPGTGDSVDLLAGSSLTIEELDRIAA